jgi:hypothetical protein
MLKQLPFKKQYLLIGSTIVLLLLSYQFSFKRTIEAWQINKNLKTQMARSYDLSLQPAYVERKSNNLNKILSLYKTDTVAFRSNIISTISLIAEKEGVKLSDVPLQNALYRSDKYIIQKLSFEGGYFALVKVLNELQGLKEIGQVRSFAFKVDVRSGDTRKANEVFLDTYLITSK